MTTIEGYTKNCPLCRLVQDREILTRLIYEDDLFVVVNCLICETPMAVLKSHRLSFTPEEKDYVRNLYSTILTDLKIITIPAILAHLTPAEYEWVIDWEQRRIPDHPHCHLRPFPFPNTRHWEKMSIPPLHTKC